MSRRSKSVTTIIQLLGGELTREEREDLLFDLVYKIVSKKTLVKADYCAGPFLLAEICKNAPGSLHHYTMPALSRLSRRFTDDDWLSLEGTLFNWKAEVPSKDEAEQLLNFFEYTGVGCSYFLEAAPKQLIDRTVAATIPLLQTRHPLAIRRTTARLWYQLIRFPLTDLQLKQGLDAINATLRNRTHSKAVREKCAMTYTEYLRHCEAHCVTPYKPEGADLACFDIIRRLLSEKSPEKSGLFGRYRDLSWILLGLFRVGPPDNTIETELIDRLRSEETLDFNDTSRGHTAISLLEWGLRKETKKTLTVELYEELLKPVFQILFYKRLYIDNHLDDEPKRKREEGPKLYGLGERQLEQIFSTLRRLAKNGIQLEPYAVSIYETTPRTLFERRFFDLVYTTLGEVAPSDDEISKIHEETLGRCRTHHIVHAIKALDDLALSDEAAISKAREELDRPS